MSAISKYSLERVKTWFKVKATHSLFNKAPSPGAFLILQILETIFPVIHSAHVRIYVLSYAGDIFSPAHRKGHPPHTGEGGVALCYDE